MRKILQLLSVLFLCSCSLITFADPNPCPDPSQITVISPSMPMSPWIGQQVAGSDGPGLGLGGSTVGQFLGSIASPDNMVWWCLYGSAQHETYAELKKHASDIPANFQFLIPHFENISNSVGMVMYKRE